MNNIRHIALDHAYAFGGSEAFINGCRHLEFSRKFYQANRGLSQKVEELQEINERQSGCITGQKIKIHDLGKLLNKKIDLLNQYEKTFGKIDYPMDDNEDHFEISENDVQVELFEGDSEETELPNDSESIDEHYASEEIEQPKDYETAHENDGLKTFIENDESKDLMEDIDEMKSEPIVEDANLSSEISPTSSSNIILKIKSDKRKRTSSVSIKNVPDNDETKVEKSELEKDNSITNLPEDDDESEPLMKKKKVSKKTKAKKDLTSTSKHNVPEQVSTD